MNKNFLIPNRKSEIDITNNFITDFTGKIQNCDCNPDLIVAVTCYGLTPPIDRFKCIQGIRNDYLITEVNLFDLKDPYDPYADKVKLINKASKTQLYNEYWDTKNNIKIYLPYSVHFINDRLFNTVYPVKYVYRSFQHIYNYFKKFRISSREHDEWKFAFLYKQNLTDYDMCKCFIIGKPKPEGGWTIITWNSYTNQELINVQR